MSAIALGSGSHPLETWVALSRPGSRVLIPSESREAMRASRAVVEAVLARGDIVYGVNTGFGKLANRTVSPERLGDLQRNLLLSHATGVGDPLPVEVVRLAFALRIHSLARGCSGVRTELVDTMVSLFNQDLVPVVPSQGSVGASGDLAPLAHLALPLIGFGEVHDGNAVIAGADALDKAGLAPVELAAKEGLALINGTQIMTALGILAVARAGVLSRTADVLCAATIEALRGSEKPFTAAVHDVRPHSGQLRTAANLRSLLQGSAIVPSHAGCGKVQDAYSMRCAPQVHGAVKEALDFAMGVLAVEADAVTDNPLVFADGLVVSAGNFHGQPVSQALDFAKIAVSTLANISERRIENLVNPDISGLPPFLAADPGVESGLMIPQVVAAALASENKTLAHPASVDTIPTSANREDHVSMGVTAARHATAVVDNATRVLAIEWISACAGLDCGEQLRPGRGVEVAHQVLREVVPPLVHDRFLAPDLRAAEELIRSGVLLARVEARCGRLG
ncbi:MAG: histidine ammonia-lyase [Planctomycetes bacterium]|nr:histidine ammonia-lyase [Planctomycetota bacterium]